MIKYGVLDHISIITQCNKILNKWKYDIAVHQHR